MADRPERQGTSGSGHDVFISYSHAADDRLAPALQRGLERLGARWPRSQALRVFRDRTGLSADASLWGAIETALDGAGWFLLLASPDAARSPWVARELDHWLAANPGSRLMVAVTDGEWGWDSSAGRPVGDAVPERLIQAFEDEPRHVDLRWARSETDLDLHHARFRDAVAELAAPVHGVTKDQLEGDFVVERRRVRTRTRLTIAALAVLALAASAFAVVAWRQTSNAKEQAERATAQSLVVQSRLVTGTRPDLAALYGAEARELVDSAQSESALIEAVNVDPLLDHVVPLDGEEPLVVSRGGEYVVTVDADGLVVRSAIDGEAIRAVELPAAARTTFSLPEEPSIPVRPGVQDRVTTTNPPTDIAPLVAIDEVSEAIAVVGADGDPGTVTTWPLDGSSEPSTHMVLDGEVREVAWLSADRLVAVFSDGNSDEVLLVDTSAPTSAAIEGTSGSEVGGCAVSVAPDAERFVVRVLTMEGEMWRVLDAETDVVAEVPASIEDRCAALTPDGQHLYRATIRGATTPGRVPGEELRPNEAILPSLELIDLRSNEVVWSLDPAIYQAYFEGTEFGNALLNPTSTVVSSADGRRAVVGIWMVGPDLGTDIVRLDPLGRSTFGWSTVPAKRSTSFDPTGASLVRLTAAGVAHFSTPLLEGLPCADLLRLTGRLVVTPDGDGFSPTCATASDVTFRTEALGPGSWPGYADPALNHVAIATPVELLVVDTADGTVRDLTADLPFPGEVRDQLMNVSELVVTDDHLIALLEADVSGAARTAHWFDLENGGLGESIRFDALVVDRGEERLIVIEDGELVTIPLDAPGDRTPIADVDVPNGSDLGLVDGSVLTISDPAGGGVDLYGADFEPIEIEIRSDETVVAASTEQGLVALRSPDQVRVVRISDDETVTEFPGEDASSAWFVGKGIAIEFDEALEYRDFDGLRAVLMASDPLHDRGPEVVGVLDDQLVVGSGARLMVDGDLAARACALAGRPLTAEEWSSAATSGSPRLCR